MTALVHGQARRVHGALIGEGAFLMLSQQDAYACLEAVASELKELSYEELERFAISHGMLGDWQSREFLVDGETVYVNTMIAKLGRIHKRISVELNLRAEGDILPADTPYLYFERYKSGRFYPSVREAATEAALFKALPYVFIGGVVIALVALVWHLFLRGG